MPDVDNSLERVHTELGEPEAAFGARSAAKLALGLGLLAASIAGHVAWWVLGPARFTGVVAKLLFLPPILAVALLWHLYRTRGLHVLLYPAGLLRFQRGEVESFPWTEITALRLKADQAGIEMVNGPSGAVTSAWLAVEPPVVQLWSVWLELTRADGETARLTPSVDDYADLVERVQRTTFTHQWPGTWTRFQAGEAVRFGPFEVLPGGLRAGDQLLAWPDLAEISVSNKHVTVKRKGKWLAWTSQELEQVPNPHLFLALVHEARRAVVPEPAPESNDEDDHSDRGG